MSERSWLDDVRFALSDPEGFIEWANELHREHADTDSTPGEFYDELLDALRESDRGEVVVADQDAGSVRTLPKFPENTADALDDAEPDDLVVLDEAGEHVRTLRESPDVSKMWAASCRHGRVTDACPICGHADEEQPNVIDSYEDADELLGDMTLRVGESIGNRRQYATLAFAEEHVEGILAGEKTVTLRLPDAYDQAVVHAAERGAEVLAVTPDGQPFARLGLRAVWAATARQVAGASLAGYPTALECPDDVLRVLERHYGDELADAGPTTGVDVVHFDVVAEVIE